MGNANSVVKPDDASIPAPSAETVMRAAADRIDETRKGKDDNDGTKAANDVFKGGRYRVAGEDATKQFYAQQPSRVHQDLLPENKIVDAKQMRQYLTDTEGLNVGQRQRDDLAVQWRFFLASDPIQHGLDAGLVAGAIGAVGSQIEPKKRHPIRAFCFGIYGFGVGMIGFPIACMVWEQWNLNRVLKSEQDMFKDQRKDFYNRVTQASSATPPPGPPSAAKS
jgi:hypothetical protein